jgi:hypothetical protein
VVKINEMNPGLEGCLCVLEVLTMQEGWAISSLLLNDMVDHLLYFLQLIVLCLIVSVSMFLH